MKKAFIRTVILLTIIGLSIGIGFGIDGLCDLIDRKTHPLKYMDYVEKYSREYSVPQSVILAVMKCESDFESNAVSKAGAVGLMQMMPDTFVWLSRDKLGENHEAGMLYDPETNIKYGTYYLSYLYLEFGRWETVYAAYNCGPNKVKEWQADTEYADENGFLKKIPIKETKNYVSKVEKAEALYKKLYFTGGK